MARYNSEEIIENIEELLDETSLSTSDGEGRRRPRRLPPTVFNRLEGSHLGPMRSHQAVDSIPDGAPLRFLKKALLRVMQLVARPQAAYNYHNLQALQNLTHEVDQLRARLTRYEESEARPFGAVELHRSDYSQLSNTIRQYLHHVRSNVEAMTRHLDDVGRTSGLLLDNLSAITGRLGKLDIVQRDLETGAASTRLDMSRLWTELGLVYESVDARAEDLWKAIEERDTQLEVNTEATQSLHSQVGRVEGAGKELRARLLVLSEQMTIHQEMLDSLREEIEQGGPPAGTRESRPAPREAPSAPAPSPAPSSAAPSSAADRQVRQQLDLAYLRFQRQFRADEEELRKRQGTYIQRLEEQLGDLAAEGAKPRVLDLACGDGIFLELLGERNWEARGVDLNEAMVKQGLSRDLPIEQGDALAFLEAQEPKSWDAVTAFQFIEHLPPDGVMRLLRLAHRALKPGGVILLETINPHTLKALHWFHLDLTHQRLIFPEMLLLLAETAGFVGVEWEGINPVAEDQRLAPAGSEADQGNIEKLNKVLFGPQDYYLTARRSRGNAG